MNSSPIAIFDSGIGGLTVLQKAKQELPQENFIYYADTVHVPYGEKTKEEVLKFVLDAVAFLSEKKIKALVIACNTATSIAVNELRSKYSFPVLGMEPAVKPAVERNNGKRVLVLATHLTLQEHKFKELVARVDNEKVVDFFALPELVTLAEDFIFEEEKVLPVLLKKFSELKIENYGTVVLGCTHFPFFKNHLKKIFSPLTDIIDGNEGTVRHLKNTLSLKNILSDEGNGEIIFYDSGNSVADATRFEKYLSFLKKN